MAKHSRRVDLVSPNIKKYVDDRKGHLSCNPEYFLRKVPMTKSKLQEEANRHSVSIELVDFSLTKSESVKNKAKEKKRCISALQNAREYAQRNFSLPLTPAYISEIGSLVDPVINKGGFRNDRVRVTGSKVSPPSPEKLYREMNIFLLENESIEDSLEKAIHTHFNIARIHPFDDGNGRTARLLQDVILQDQDLPLAMIPLFERQEYLQKLGDAIESYHDKQSKFEGEVYHRLRKLVSLTSEPNLSDNQLEEAQLLSKYVLSYSVTSEMNAFYDFIALKVLNGLSQELERLYPSEEMMRKYLRANKKR